jgi:hypothetical protein
VLTLPLYDGGLRTGISRERDAVLAEARANLEAGLRQAQAEIRADFEAMIRADLALPSARATPPGWRDGRWSWRPRLQGRARPTNLRGDRCAARASARDADTGAPRRPRTLAAGAPWTACVASGAGFPC